MVAEIIQPDFIEALSQPERDRLQHLETVIQTGLQTFVEVGNALIEIRESKLYREDGTFESYCNVRWGIERRRAYQLMDAAKVVTELSGDVKNFSHLPSTESHAAALAKVEPEKRSHVWEETMRRTDGNPTAKAISEVASGLPSDRFNQGSEDTDPVWKVDEGEDGLIEAKNNRSATLNALLSSASNEWYTPADYVEAARRVMGQIDLDPASNPMANQTVKAGTFYTIDDDGLSQQWKGCVFLNPPYGKDEDKSAGNQAVWTERLLDEYLSGNVSQAVLVVNAATERKWFQPLWDYPICFTDHRIKFYRPEGEGVSPTIGNAIIYLGDRLSEFVNEFRQFGRIATAIDGDNGDENF